MAAFTTLLLVASNGRSHWPSSSSPVVSWLLVFLSCLNLFVGSPWMARLNNAARPFLAFVMSLKTILWLLKKWKKSKLLLKSKEKASLASSVRSSNLEIFVVYSLDVCFNSSSNGLVPMLSYVRDSKNKSDTCTVVYILIRLLLFIELLCSSNLQLYWIEQCWNWCPCYWCLWCCQGCLCLCLFLHDRYQAWS